MRNVSGKELDWNWKQSSALEEGASWSLGLSLACYGDRELEIFARLCQPISWWRELKSMAFKLVAGVLSTSCLGLASVWVLHHTVLSGIWVTVLSG